VGVGVGWRWGGQILEIPSWSLPQEDISGRRRLGRVSVNCRRNKWTVYQIWGFPAETMKIPSSEMWCRTVR